VTAIALPKPLQSYDISWVNPQRAEYYLADRSNNAIDVIDTHHLKFKRSLGQGLFVGLKFNAAGTATDNNHSGPDGVVTHGRWVYAGDGDSTLKVLDLDSPPASALKASVSTGGTTRLDEMALTTDGKLLIAANNAEDPPFATLFRANGELLRAITATSLNETVANSLWACAECFSAKMPGIVRASPCKGHTSQETSFECRRPSARVLRSFDRPTRTHRFNTCPKAQRLHTRRPSESVQDWNHR